MSGDKSNHRLIVTDDGVKLAVSVLGGGPPTLLLAGLGGKGSFWNDVSPHLLDGRQLIVPDHRGCGASDRPSETYHIARLAEDALCILNDLSVDCVDVIGHSTGGVIAQHLALHNPERVRDLVLSGTWNRPDAHFMHTFETRLAVLQTAGPLVYTQLTASLGFPPDWFDDPSHVTPQQFHAIAEDLHPMDVSVARLRMLLDHRGVPDRELARITSRVLILGAADDAIIPLRHQHRLHQALPGSDLQELSGGHFFPRSRPAQVGELLNEFLSQSK